jgi:hypothetical protein
MKSGMPNPQSKAMDLITRILFFLAGIMFAFFAYWALRDGQIPGKGDNPDIPVEEAPIWYWTVVGMYLFFAIALICGPFVKDRRDGRGDKGGG